ncbi:metal-sensitive transcriptional regulator [Arcanobacterium ihumii]|uniref:metal-sensitive transcriptional regulator n=1 Tax=Arcanobacterium ihumii TaxID=2138162 RepID=UPI00190F0F97|nr:metal-sensitive transcriptional regulator [Arcanobacterium ihumii]
MARPTNAQNPILLGSGAQIDPNEVTKVRNRLSRAIGQLQGVVGMIDNGESCEATMMQMLAASKAVDRAAFALLLAGFNACSDSANDSAESRAALERLFMSLA